MGAAYFYHLTQSTLDGALHKLLPRARAAGWRIEIRGRDMSALKRLDHQLWEGPVDGFLPHGIAGTPDDPLQPILLTHEPSNHSFECVMAVHGADVSIQEVTGAERVCILFDGNDSDAVQHARVQWKTLTAGGVSAQYWSEASGSWEKKAET